MHFTQLAAVIGGTLYNSSNANNMFTGVTIDSRSVNPGELFFAIRGVKNDGHDFIEQAIARGASGIVSESNHPRLEQIRGDVAVVAVDDSHEAMLILAKKYRDSIDARFIGITGSNGKTTTKELTYRLIKTVEQKTYYSPGNFNNLYGVPLALYSVKKDAKVVVLELGISSYNEMLRLADIVHPEMIIITNIGPSHLEFLDSVEAIAQAKLELVKRADAEVPVIINADNYILLQETKKIRKRFITFALENDADFKIDAVDESEIGSTNVTIDGYVFKLPLFGRHQVYNLLAAYAAFKTFGYSFNEVDTRQISLETAPLRGQKLVKDNITFIADCYNANPESVKAGLHSFFNTRTDGRRILVLGDMLELGKESIKYHKEIGRILANEQFDIAVMVGEMTKYIIQEAVDAGKSDNLFKHFDNSQDAASAMKDYLQSGDFVYLKGSRGIGLEAILNLYEKKMEAN